MRENTTLWWALLATVALGAAPAACDDDPSTTFNSAGSAGASGEGGSASGEAGRAGAGHGQSGAGQSGAGQSGAGQGQGGTCNSPGNTVTVKGTGFVAYEGVTVVGSQFASQNCAPGPNASDDAKIEGGAFELSMTTVTGYGHVVVFIDLDNDKEPDADEPDWNSAEGGEGNGEGGWQVSPDAFDLPAAPPP